MTITTITDRHLYNAGNFENRTVEATAAVADGEDPTAALAALRTFVDGQIEQIDREANPWKYRAAASNPPAGTVMPGDEDDAL